MTATLATVPTVAPSIGRLLRDGAVAGVLAAVATAAVAATGQAAGISLDVSGAPIPVPGFAVTTAIFATLGLLIALALRRYAARPRTAWIRTTVVLTALSFTPDLLADAAPTTKALLMTTHLIAAAIIIPAVARRLR
ncbi:hypothetical protein GCM10029976_091930 [Kribbella albertanoniae]|uniref:Cell envelope biogenesis protein OmpA n=1 Tax=Kribbella albertanoniae TaxID=1266829 RepID=A0A4R4Q6C8_9ACTN|nr:DUF6069 family protein [Kribbella albertanoniae]TDC30781.1 hypothetical protein E1261_12650 [Kribbella albertanoniae]